VVTHSTQVSVVRSQAGLVAVLQSVLARHCTHVVVTVSQTASGAMHWPPSAVQLTTQRLALSQTSVPPLPQLVLVMHCTHLSATQYGVVAVHSLSPDVPVTHWAQAFVVVSQ
jgi:hypothetical protein